MNEPALLQLSNGESVLIQLNHHPVVDVPVSVGDRVAAAAGHALREVLGKVVGVSEDVLDVVRRLPESPREVTVSFGVDVTAESDLVIAKASGGANFTVTITWDGRR